MSLEKLSKKELIRELQDAESRADHDGNYMIQLEDERDKALERCAELELAYCNVWNELKALKQRHLIEDTMEKLALKFRNYNLGRSLDKHTPEFEEKLDKLVRKYGVYMETETFDVKDMQNPQPTE